MPPDVIRALFEVFRVLVLVLVVCAVGLLYGLHWQLQDELREHAEQAMLDLWSVEQAIVELDDNKMEVSRAAE